MLKEFALFPWLHRFFQFESSVQQQVFLTFWWKNWTKWDLDEIHKLISPTVSISVTKFPKRSRKIRSLFVACCWKAFFWSTFSLSSNNQKPAENVGAEGWNFIKSGARISKIVPERYQTSLTISLGTVLVGYRCCRRTSNGYLFFPKIIHELQMVSADSSFQQPQYLSHRKAPYFDRKSSLHLLGRENEVVLESAYGGLVDFLLKCPYL